MPMAKKDDPWHSLSSWPERKNKGGQINVSYLDKSMDLKPIDYLDQNILYANHIKIHQKQTELWN